jgi:hypothetical protein
MKRLGAAARTDGMTMTGIVHEAILIHLHRLETCGSREHRRFLKAWGVE